VELGIVGLALWIVLGLTISLSAWKVTRALRETPWFPLSFVIFTFSSLLFFPMTFVGIAYQDFVINAYLWLLLGILYHLRVLSKEVQAAQHQSFPRQG